MILDYIIKYWVGWAMGLLAAGITYLWRQSRRQRKTDRAIEHGLKALLRDRIIQMYGVCKSKGFCSLQERESLESLYQAYHEGLLGNGTVTDVYNSIRTMPRERAERKETQ